MYCLIDFCCICFSHKENLQYLSDSDSDNITYYSKLTSCVAKMCFNEINNQWRVCNNCCEIMDVAYKFHEKCLQSKTTLTDYFSQLHKVGNVSGTVNVYLTDINKFCANLSTIKQNTEMIININEDMNEKENFDSLTEIKRENNAFNIELNDNAHNYIQFENIEVKIQQENQHFKEHVDRHENLDNILINQDEIKIDITDNDIKLTTSAIKKENENQISERHYQESFKNFTETCYNDNDNMAILQQNLDYPLHSEICFDTEKFSEDNIIFLEDENKTDEVIDCDSSPNTHPDITAVSSINLLPQKSLDIYKNTYYKFMKWRKEKNIDSFAENVILMYLLELAKNFKSSTLWSHYSMLKSTINSKHNINIGEYPKVRVYLKRKNEGYVPKKSRILEKEQIAKFIMEAPDQQFILTKIILIFGVAGALRRDELYKLKTDDIEDLGTILIVSIDDTKTEIKRKFTITKHLELYRKYVALRPKNYPEKKFFINFHGGKCTRQVIGINKFGRVPCEIAKYLKLPNAEEYTGHCFRRSSASLDKAKEHLPTQKKTGSRKSSAVDKNRKLKK